MCNNSCIMFDKARKERKKKQTFFLSFFKLGLFLTKSTHSVWQFHRNPSTSTFRHLKIRFVLLTGNPELFSALFKQKQSCERPKPFLSNMTYNMSSGLVLTTLLCPPSLIKTHTHTANTANTANTAFGHVLCNRFSGI